MTKLMGQNLEMLQVTDGVFNDDPHPGELLVQQFLFLVQRMISSGFEGGDHTMLWQIISQAIIAGIASNRDLFWYLFRRTRPPKMLDVVDTAWGGTTEMPNDPRAIAVVMLNQ